MERTGNHLKILWKSLYKESAWNDKITFSDSADLHRILIEVLDFYHHVEQVDFRKAITIWF